MPVVLDPTKEFITLRTYYTETGNNICILDIPSENCQYLDTTWRRPSWGEQNVILSQSLRYKGISLDVDILVYQDLKLKTCLKNWNAKDDDNNPIPLNNDAIDNLDPVISSALLKQFESISEPSDVDLKALEQIAKRFYEGKNHLGGLFPQYIYEHLIAKYYGWSLKEIRDMDYYDFLVHLRLCVMADGQDKEFELTTHGKSTKKDLSAADIMKKKALQRLGGTSES